MFNSLFGAKGVLIESDSILVKGKTKFTDALSFDGIGEVDLKTNQDFTGTCTISNNGGALFGSVYSGGQLVAPTQYPFRFSRCGSVACLYIPGFDITIASGSMGDILFQNFNPPLPKVGSTFYQQVRMVDLPSNVVSQSLLQLLHSPQDISYVSVVFVPATTTRLVGYTGNICFIPS